MTGPEVLDVARDAIITLVLVSAPLMLVGLVVGVVDLAVPGADPDPGNDAGVRAEDPRDLRRHAGGAAVHGAMRCRATWRGSPRASSEGGCACHDPESGNRFSERSCVRRSTMQIDVSFLPAFAAAFMLMFARIGTMVMLLPGLGELSVPARVRLTIALVLTAVLMPLHRSAYTVDLRALRAGAASRSAQELLIGVVLGLTARLTISALQVAGSVIAQQLGSASSPRSIRRRASRA